MAEPGGPTTQSGIFYQNSVAALYLGAMLDLRPPVGKPRVNSVRIEAPENIDDIVVTFGNHSTLFIQAKEHLAPQGDPWNKFWESVRKQSTNCRSGRDEFRLVLGNLSKPLEVLRETVERTQGKNNFSEWQNALNGEQAKIAKSVLDALTLPQSEAFSVLKRIRIEFLTLATIETTGVRDWMPSSSAEQLGLYSHLRDCCGSGARVRQTFLAAELSELLLSKYGVRIFGSHGDGLEQYRKAIGSQFDHIAVPGTSISLREGDLFTWPTIRSVNKATHSDFEDENLWPVDNHSGEEVDLCDFPSQDMKWIILESGAGYGKSTILRATTRRLISSTAHIPAFIHADAVQSYATIQDYLAAEYNASYKVAIDWEALCEQGRAVLLIDGLDELNDTARASLTNMIVRAAARFPATPILIGARDASVAVLPPQFKLFQVQRLNWGKMISMLERYIHTRLDLNLRVIVSHIREHQELDLLCRVPLFLAIFVGTIPKNGKIPTSRTELLERYISLAVSPQRHKPTQKSVISKTQLRRGAEVVALLALERNEAALPERAIRACLSKELGQPIGDECADTLIQYGLLERRGARIAFSIPTVQEYLAGCVLAENDNFQSNDWFINVYRRPWAQAIQFAIEKVTDADALLRRQIEHKDDLFYTSLRLVARCIVNGASVTTDFRDVVAGKLAHAWTRGSHNTKKKIGGLIADGFCRPLHPTIRQQLVRSESFISARPAILYRAADNVLTLECLRLLLEQSDIRELWSLEWHEVLRPIAVDAIELLAQRARAETGGGLPAAVIAEVFYRLRDDARVNWMNLSSDSSIPLVVRAAAQFGLKEVSNELQTELITAAIAGTKGFFMWKSFHQAYISTNWWKEHFCGLCQAAPQKDGETIFRYMDAEGDVAQQFLDLISEIASNPTTHPHHRFSLQIILGRRGSTEFSEAATDSLQTADIEQIHQWVNASLYFSESTMKRGVLTISARKLSQSDQISILYALADSVLHKPYGKQRHLLLGGPFVKLEQPGEVAAIVADWGERLIRDGNLTEIPCRDLVLTCAKCGSEESKHRLLSYVEDYLDNHDHIEEDDWTWLASCLFAVLESSVELGTDRLWQVIEKARTLPVSFIMAKIIAKEGPDIHPTLIEYFEKGDSKTAKMAIWDYFEQSAERQGLIVRIIDGKLNISSV